MSSTVAVAPAKLTAALEDYLETVYELVRDRKIARVKDIAQARSVKASSVTPAMKRLAEMGLVRYEQREYIELTEEGEARARKVYARHQVLTSFLEEVLNLPPELAAQDACALEHRLSDQTMDRMVRFFEYMRSCPNANPDFIERFHRCARVNQDATECVHSCPNRLEHLRERSADQSKDREKDMSIADLQPGQQGVIRQVNAQGAIRQRLLDMGVLPDTPIQVERVAPAGGPVWIRIGGYQLSLRRTEAAAVLLSQD
jgi:DtxR family Mn-dependent transcriptional regulator